MTDSSPPSTDAAPVIAATAHAPEQSLNLGFLTIVHDANGVLGGYLVTNSWGRPLEFRLSTAVQPNRVQQILYGPTLNEYLHGELIGKTLVEKTSVLPRLLVSDSLPSLGLRQKLGIPMLALRPGGLDLNSAELLAYSHPRSSAPLVYSAKQPEDRDLLNTLLEAIDPAVDLAEPFSRIREAVAEARKMGVTNRAA